jgi:phosphate transport system permease protein
MNWSKKPSLIKSDDRRLLRRHQKAKVWKRVFFLAVTTGIIALATLIASIINQSFGLVAYNYQINPSTLSINPLTELNSQELIAILQNNLPRNRIRVLEKEKPLDKRTQHDLYRLVIDRVANPEILATWHLDQSILHRKAISEEVAGKYPGAVLEFRSWLSWDFIKNTMSSDAGTAGIRSALIGSLQLILTTILIAFPMGVGAAIYLEEYTNKKSRLNQVLQTNIDNLAGVPSIVYGILGLAIFVRMLGPFTSGAVFGIPADNGRTILSAGLTMAMLVLPIIIVNAQEAIRAVPNSLRQASYGLGATRWQTIWHHVLPSAMSGILTGTILAISRAIGETAPLIVVGASTFISNDPSGPFSHFTALPIQIYNWTSRPQDQFRNIAAAAILVLLILLLSMNAVAILLRNHFSSRK